MNIPIAFSHFWRHEITKINDTVSRGETLAVCGLYGIGKNILARVVCEKNRSETTKIIRISLKDLPHPNRQSIFAIIAAELTGDHSQQNIFQNDFDFHYFLRRVLKNRPEKKFIFIFEEAQNMLAPYSASSNSSRISTEFEDIKQKSLNNERNMGLAPYSVCSNNSHISTKSASFPDSFFESFESLRYYFSPRVSILFFGQPQIYNFASIGFKHLIKNNYIFLKPFDKKTCETDINFIVGVSHGKPLHINSIFHFSKGHHGTIKFLLQKLDKSQNPNPKSQINSKNQIPKILNKKTVEKWILEEPLMSFWIKNEIASLTENQQQLIAAYLENPGVSIKLFQNKTAFQDLINFGIFKTRGQKISFLYDPFNFILKKYFEKNDKQQFQGLKVKNGVLTLNNEPVDEMFNFQEKQALKGLFKAEVLSYETIAKILWGTKWEEKFSLWAINKIISRLRKKLLLLGNNAPRIQTISKKGYKLLS